MRNQVSEPCSSAKKVRAFNAHALALASVFSIFLNMAAEHFIVLFGLKLGDTLDSFKDVQKRIK